MRTLGHQMILASAGSGKTYALTNRFVQLLALGAQPERIVALTFTRKAAGEFFDEILNKLARAAREPDFAAKIADEVGQPGLRSADFLRLLRAMVDAMHRLSLGTLDGFFARVVRAFPLELGLGGDFEILQEHGERRERQRVLRQLFTRAGDDLADAQREFIEAFKRATFGAEEKRLAARLDRFIDEHQNLYLDAPRAEAWGNPARIWPEGGAWLGAAGDPVAARQLLDAWAGSAGLGEKQRERWREFAVALETWAPGATLPRELVYVLEKGLEKWAELLRGEAVLEFDRKKQALSPAACAALVSLTRHIFGGELKRRLEMTRGIHTVLRGYEALYHDLVRREGRLTFADVQRLLMPESGAPRLTSGGADAENGEATAGTADRESAEEARLLIDWRLDARFDHWLLDEFQDTSHGQWSVLRNLIDEAVQDPEGRRSLFYVGDVKQAIFAWRGGDPRLFREIFEHYNAIVPGTIVEGRLDQSWRSGPAIIATVNRVFGDAAALAKLCPGPAAERWTQEWRDHRSARPTLGGQAAWLLADDEPARFALTLELLQEIRPLERGLSVAVLVQSNDAATTLADYLRREGGLPAVAASDLRVCLDNPLTTALLALFKAAAHPGDRLAWEQVRMTPLDALLKAEQLALPERLSLRLLGQVHAGGFERTVEAWLRNVETCLAPDDRFSRGRGRQLAEAARLFDEAGSRDVAEFIQFAERHVVREAETPAVVRVMTIHKSKGLGFDVVLLPDLEGQALSTRRRDGLAVQKSEDRAVEWVFDLPPKLFHDHDEALSAHVAAAEADAAYEKLCLFYVAMTRAKRAMYLITKPVGAKSVSANFPRLLTETLGGAAGEVRVGGLVAPGGWTEGEADWFTGMALVAPEEKPAAGMAVLDETRAPRVLRRLARTPSGTKGGVVTGAMLFGATGSRAAEFGTAVHAAFSTVEWGDHLDLAEWAAERRQAGLGATAIAEARACLESPALAAVFRRPPAGAAEVWRERAFEVVLDEAWITGIFDRVVLVRDALGRIAEVTIYDFKTDRVESERELAEIAGRYAGQLEIYRRAAVMLAGVPAQKVRCVLVLTALRRTVGEGRGVD